MARLSDTRRLTGRSLLLPRRGAAAEVVVDAGDDVVDLERRLRAAIVATLARVELSAEGLVVRRSRQGLSFAVPAPADALLAAADALEVAIAGVLGQPVEPEVAALEDTRARDRHPALVTLLEGLEARGVPHLVDDEGVDVGLGVHARHFDLTALPAPADVDSPQARPVPVAVVTGTNGKTTTVRLLSAILKARGLVVGTTSTDGVAIDGVVVDSGDWSGPGGARRVLRDPRVEAAVLETARGGLLRRGLALEGYDVGVVTNVADDHLGEHGVDSLEDMADVKWLVAEGVADDGVVIIHAADPRLVARAAKCRARVVPVARTRDPLMAWLARGDEVWCVEAGDGGPWIVRVRGGETTPVASLARVPLTFGGAAGYNVDNALLAAAAAAGLGVADDAIAAGLAAVKPSSAQSPGRSNVFRHADGRVVVVDFAHNPAAMAALGGLVSHLRSPGARLIVGVGAPGDRLDEELSDLGDAVADLGPDVVLLRELPHYLRGRAPGDVPSLLRRRLLSRGVAVRDDVAADDGSGVRAILAALGPGDIGVFTPVVEPATVFAILRERGFHDDA